METLKAMHGGHGRIIAMLLYIKAMPCMNEETNKEFSVATRFIKETPNTRLPN